jgi:hypothetical protein
MAALAPSTNGQVHEPVTGQTGKGMALTISPPNFQRLTFRLEGVTPYMQNRMSQKAINEMHEKHKAGDTEVKKRKPRAARDFDADYEGAFHRDRDGRCGIPASAFRNAMIDVCRVAGYTMTKAKMSVFVVADALDAQDRTPLVWLHGEPERIESTVRNATGVTDLRVRPMWEEWWIDLTVEYDADQFDKPEYIANLVLRAGRQVGVGEGRPYSKDSNGMDYGRFTIGGGQA